MLRPSMARMPAALGAAARRVAERVRGQGARAWLVGGAVRDLALGLEPHDVDVASALTPEEIERLFPVAIGVGRAFGSMVLLIDGVEVQATTFRTERGYSDARRPDEVRFGRTVEEDAARRDFTCNALFLDPLTDELADPVGGLADLDAGVLRAVGEPTERFREDGLRLLRLARFAATLGLAVEPATLAGARAALASLAGVSRERVHAELGLLPERGGAAGTAGAFGILVETGIWGALGPPGLPADPAARAAALGCLPERPSLALVLATFLATAPPEARVQEDTARAWVRELRGPRTEERIVVELWELRRRLHALIGSGAPAEAGPGRAERIRLVRHEAFPEALGLVRALGEADAPVEELLRWASARAPEELRPTPWITSADLAHAGVRPGPAFGALLAEAEERQLGGVDRSRADALAWLGGRARELPS